MREGAEDLEGAGGRGEGAEGVLEGGERAHGVGGMRWGGHGLSRGCGEACSLSHEVCLQGCRHQLRYFCNCSFPVLNILRLSTTAYDDTYS